MTPPIARVALVFDDGFERSCRIAAEHFERRGLRACFAVVSAWSDDPPPGRGGWDLWRELSERGHRIDPHGSEHVDLTQLDPDAASEQIDRCLASFAARLPDFDASRAVFHYPYNRGSDELDELLLARVQAVRRGGDGHNSPSQLASGRWHCTAHGPDACDAHLEALVAALARDPRETTLIYNLHGLDHEGWGPLSTAALERILDRLAEGAGPGYWDLG